MVAGISGAGRRKGARVENCVVRQQYFVTLVSRSDLTGRRASNLTRGD